MNAKRFLFVGFGLYQYDLNEAEIEQSE